MPHPSPSYRTKPELMLFKTKGLILAHTRLSERSSPTEFTNTPSCRRLLLLKEEKSLIVFSLQMNIKHSRRRKQKGVMVKLDLETAYDKTDWEFLDYTMARKGLGKWRLRYMTALYYSLFHSHKWHPQRILPCLKGSQARTLYRLFYLNWSRILSADSSLTQGIFRGSLVGAEKVSYLWFANDTLLLMSREQRNVLMLKSLIHCFELYSRLEVNWTKVHLLGISLPESKCIQMAHMLGFVNIGWPSEYSSLLLGGSLRKKAPWESIQIVAKGNQLPLFWGKNDSSQSYHLQPPDILLFANQNTQGLATNIKKTSKSILMEARIGFKTTSS